MSERLEETKRVRLTLGEDPRIHIIVNLTVNKIRARIAKIEKNLKKLNSIFASTEAKLNNKDFLENAPSDVIEGEYMKYASFKSKIPALETELKDLKSVLEDK
jgi:valyl-tRNA synthetase